MLFHLYFGILDFVHLHFCLAKLEASLKNQSLGEYLKFKFLALLACYDDE